MTKAFLPPLDTQWRLTADWTPNDPFLRRHDNNETLWGLKRYGTVEAWQKATGDKADRGTAWVARMTAWEESYKAERGTPQFLKGTVLQIERYHVSRSGDDQITLKVLASPEPLLTPKKLKGKMSGPGRIYFTLGELNTLPELEQVHDLL